MFNCVILKRHGRIIGIFHAVADAEYIKRLICESEGIDYDGAWTHGFTSDWAYIPDLPF